LAAASVYFLFRLLKNSDHGRLETLGRGDGKLSPCHNYVKRHKRTSKILIYKFLKNNYIDLLSPGTDIMISKIFSPNNSVIFQKTDQNK
jgi:hypothetical protein